MICFGRQPRPNKPSYKSNGSSLHTWPLLLNDDDVYGRKIETGVRHFFFKLKIKKRDQQKKNIVPSGRRV